jgi:hypothetical protein
VPLLILKLVATPLIVGGAALAARRWGPAIGGLLVALPLTSGPVAFFLALGQGEEFAARAIEGSLGGLIAIAAYTVAYAVVGPRHGAAGGWAAASAAFVAVGLAIQPLLGGSAWVLYGAVLLAITAALRFLPPPVAWSGHAVHPRWDLPARVVVGTSLVLLFTMLAPIVGASLGGLIATYPVYISVLAVFTHRTEGVSGAIEVLRGLLAGLYGTATFMLIVNLTVVPWGIGPAFATAIGVTLAIEVPVLRAVRETTAGAPEFEPEAA